MNVKAIFHNSTLALLGGLSVFWFFSIPSSPKTRLLSHFFSVIFWPLFLRNYNRSSTPQQQLEEGDIETCGNKKCSSDSDSLFPFFDYSRKAQKRDAQCRLYELPREIQQINAEAEDDSEDSKAENLSENQLSILVFYTFYSSLNSAVEFACYRSTLKSTKPPRNFK